MFVVTVLALDSAGARCSVCLAHDGVVIERALAQPRAHASHILGMVSQVLAEAGIELGQVSTLAYGEGPGALTGLRVAASVVQGFALVTGARIVAVSNLLALATRVGTTVAPGTRVVIAHEAGMGMVCVQSFDTAKAATVIARDKPAVVEPGDVSWPEGPLCVAGGGSARVALPAAAGWWGGAATLAHASDIVAAVAAGGGREVAIAQAQPVYLRHPVDGNITL